MSGGYTYTTISAEPGQPVRIRVEYFLGAHAWIALCGSGSGKPHLAISQGDVSVTLSPACPGRVTGQDARMARTIADQATAYAAEVKQLAAESTTDDSAA